MKNDKHTLDDRNRQGHHRTLRGAVCNNQHRAVCSGASKILDSTWSKKGVVKDLQWFQQDGATPHTSNETLAWLQNRFSDRLIRRRCDPEWSLHSPDLNTPDFYLWGYLKHKVYGNNPKTIPDLKTATTRAMRAGHRKLCSSYPKVLAAAGSSFRAYFFKRLWNLYFLCYGLEIFHMFST